LLLSGFFAVSRRNLEENSLKRLNKYKQNDKIIYQPFLKYEQNMTG